jgi:hypothetical protein
VDATRIARVRQHGRASTGEPQLVIDVFKQDHTGIGRQAATIEVKINCFGPHWRHMQQGWLKWGCHISWHLSHT